MITQLRVNMQEGRLKESQHESENAQICGDYPHDPSVNLSPIAFIRAGGLGGEYSRELGAKVFAGQCRLITLGYRQGKTC